MKWQRLEKKEKNDLKWIENEKKLFELGKKLKQGKKNEKLRNYTEWLIDDLEKKIVNERLEMKENNDLKGIGKRNWAHLQHV